VVIILLNTAERVVPASQVAELRRGILTFLSASHLAMFDQAAAKREFERSKQIEASLPEPAATFMRYVNTRDVAALGPKLLPHVQAFGAEPSLSPERAPSMPVGDVFLLHGSDDNVIPAVESVSLSRHFEGRVPVRALITPLITHAEANRSAKVLAVWNLISFWAAVLDR
jgi:hypothetical protein